MLMYLRNCNFSVKYVLATKFLFAMLSVLLLLAMAGCRPGEAAGTAEPSVIRHYPVMGTMAEVKLYGEEAAAARAADAVQAEFLAVEKACSIFDPESEISRLNERAGKAPVACSELLWGVLVSARRFHAFSDGAFDITARPLMDLWGFYRKRQALPDEAEIAAARQRIGLDKVAFDDAARSIRFLAPDVRLDLGGIAKGYAVDRAVAAAVAQGITAGTINLGGNVACLSAPPPGRDTYHVGIRHPRHRDTLCGRVAISGGLAMATSGDYERSVEIEGRRFAHIMDPATGRPVADMLGVTVITPLAVDSDGLSTAIFIRGEALARRACTEIPGTRVLIIRSVPGGDPEILRLGPGWEECRL
jgi:thiamine biosynthesis lipoprotein